MNPGRAQNQWNCEQSRTLQLVCAESDAVANRFVIESCRTKKTAMTIRDFAQRHGQLIMTIIGSITVINGMILVLFWPRIFDYILFKVRIKRKEMIFAQFGLRTRVCDIKLILLPPHAENILFQNETSLPYLYSQNVNVFRKF